MSGREPGFVGERLTEVREARGFNQTELAGLLGVKRASISHYERNQRSPDGEIITRLCQILGVPEAFFFTRSESTGTKIPSFIGLLPVLPKPTGNGRSAATAGSSRLLPT